MSRPPRPIPPGPPRAGRVGLAVLAAVLVVAFLSGCLPPKVFLCVLPGVVLGVLKIHIVREKARTNHTP